MAQYRGGSCSKKKSIEKPSSTHIEKREVLIFFPWVEKSFLREKGFEHFLPLLRGGLTFMGKRGGDLLFQGIFLHGAHGKYSKRRRREGRTRERRKQAIGEKARCFEEGEKRQCRVLQTLLGSF